MANLDPVISIIVPTWRDDERRLRTLLADLGQASNAEVVVAAAAEEVSTHERLRAAHPHARWVFAPRGRASQMNAGVAVTHGDWLLFLHADSRLSQGWQSAIQRAARDEGVVGGSYRLTLDSADWRARSIEAGVGARVRLLGLPSGDQALFVRRDVFTALGGYRDLPLMEDLDLVLRLKRVGSLLHHELPVLTSAHRWERDGWFYRSVQNVWLATLYFAGVPPAALARRYFQRRPVVVAMMAHAPRMNGKLRLVAYAPTAQSLALRMALFCDTLGVVCSVKDVDPIVLCDPADACEEVRGLVGPEIDVLAQRDGDLGQRLRGGFEDLFRLGAAGAIIVGSNLPHLPVDLVISAKRALAERGDRVVLGPTAGGGYYLVGLKSPHPELFSRIDWQTDHVLQQTIARAQSHRLRVRLLPPWYHIGTWPDLACLGEESFEGAPLTRAWLQQSGRLSGQAPETCHHQSYE
jgi:rSAM/selenodomain-associated transferase 2/rSAM/selenodomain-associated transferase 1